MMRPFMTGWRKGRSLARAAGEVRSAAVERLEDRRLFAGFAVDTIPFTGPNGANPSAGLVMDAQGNLFGTTASGGQLGFGTIFEVVHGTNQITTLASFNGANGRAPQAPLTLDANGNLYGTASAGGANNLGVVFELPRGTSNITVLGSFDGGNGATPLSGLVRDGAGNLFGTASAMGDNGAGTVFEVVQGTSVVTKLASFNGRNGATPSGALFRDGDGNLFGTTQAGGLDPSGTLLVNAGTVFELVAGTGGITTVASFNADGSTGANPQGGVVADAQGNLFGTTANSVQGGGSGGVFEVVRATARLVQIAGFNGTNGQHPVGPVFLDSSGNIFGTASAGGANGNGTVFEIVAGSGQVTALANFDRSNGSSPASGVVMDSAGNLFGTTQAGGGGNADGVVFELMPITSPTHLVFTNVPTGATAGAKLTPAVTVAVEDANDNVVTSDFSTITLILAGGTAGATLGGTLTKPAVNGVATFGNLTIDMAGTGYVLHAADGTLTPGDTAAFAVAPPAVPGLTPKIVTLKLPAAVVGGAKLTGDSIKVSLTDAVATKGYALKVFASSDAVLDENADTLVTSVSNKGASIKGGKALSVTVPVKSLPASLPDGPYFLIVEAVDSGGNKATAVSASPITVAKPFVSLAATATSSLPASVVSGGTVKGTVTVGVTNTGNVTATTTVSVTASTAGGVAGTPIATSKKTTIPAGKTVKVAVPVKKLPALADGTYFVVAQATDSATGAAAVATAPGTVTAAAPFVSLTATLGPAGNGRADTLTLKNDGNAADNSVFHATLGFSLDAAGTQPIGMTTTATTKTVKLAAGKSAAVKLTGWAAIVGSGLEPGVPYFLTATVSDAKGISASAVSSTSFVP